MLQINRVNERAKWHHVITDRKHSLSHSGDFLEDLLAAFGKGLVLTSHGYTEPVIGKGLQQEFITPYSHEQNDLVEQVVRTLKNQRVQHRRYEIMKNDSRVIGDWIGFYNHRRPQQAMNMKTPAVTFV